MKKLKKLTLFYLKYFFYFLITVNERNNYFEACRRGYDCVNSHDASRIIYGSSRMYYFDKSKPPKKHYMTYQEYKDLYYPFPMIKGS